jgi:hypothetical protein
VSQDLEIHDCGRLKTLSDNLKLGGSLKLMDCPLLDQLPAKLRVANYVSIRGCPGLARLTESDIETMAGARHVVLGGDVSY